jgi:hypothetical protein
MVLSAGAEVLSQDAQRPRLMAQLAELARCRRTVARGPGRPHQPVAGLCGAELSTTHLARAIVAQAP